VKHHRAGSVDEGDVVFGRYAVCVGRFAMSADKHLCVAELLQVAMMNRLHTAPIQPGYLGLIMNNIAQTE
jgi:hypothetical protein